MDLNAMAQWIMAIIGGVSLLVSVIIIIINRENNMSVIKNDIKWMKNEIENLANAVDDLRNKIFIMTNKKKEVASNEKLK